MSADYPDEGVILDCYSGPEVNPFRPAARTLAHRGWSRKEIADALAELHDDVREGCSLADSEFAPHLRDDP